MKKILTIAIILFIFTAAGLFAQNNDILDKFYASEEAPRLHSVYLVLASNAMISQETGLEEIRELIRHESWGRKLLKKEDKPITLGLFALVIMDLYDIPGGLFYSLFHGRKYAAREIIYRGFLKGRASPGRVLTPFEVTYCLQEVIDWKKSQSKVYLHFMR